MDPNPAAFITLSVIGKLLARPDVLTRTPRSQSQSKIPAVHRLVIYFEGGDGVSQITGCELYGANATHPLESDDAELLLETRIPVAEGQEPVAIGRLLDGAILTLLDLRDPEWVAGSGSAGQAEIRWRSLPNGDILTSLGGTLRSH